MKVPSMFQPTKLLIHPQNSLTFFFPPWHPIYALWDLGQSSGTTLWFSMIKIFFQWASGNLFFFVDYFNFLCPLDINKLKFTIITVRKIPNIPMWCRSSCCLVEILSLFFFSLTFTNFLSSESCRFILASSEKKLFSCACSFANLIASASLSL